MPSCLAWWIPHWHNGETHGDRNKAEGMHTSTFGTLTLMCVGPSAHLQVMQSSLDFYHEEPLFQNRHIPVARQPMDTASANWWNSTCSKHNLSPQQKNLYEIGELWPLKWMLWMSASSANWSSCWWSHAWNARRCWIFPICTSPRSQVTIYSVWPVHNKHFANG